MDTVAFLGPGARLSNDSRVSGPLRRRPDSRATAIHLSAKASAGSPLVQAPSRDGNDVHHGSFTHLSAREQTATSSQLVLVV